MSPAAGRSFRSWPRGLEHFPECQCHALRCCELGLAPLERIPCTSGRLLPR